MLPMLELIHLKAQDLRTLPREKTWIFLAVGTVEDHGPHLPIGMDLMEGDAVFGALLPRLQLMDPQIVGVKFPTIPLSIESNTPHLALHLRPHVVRDYLVDLVDSFYKEGFRYFAVYSGTFGPRQLTAIEDAAQFLRRKHGGVFGVFKRRKSPLLLSLSSVAADPETESRSLLWLDPPEHGGRRDTSFALKYFPRFVGSIQPELSGEMTDGSTIERFFKFRKRKTAAFWGHPEKADPEVSATNLDEKIKAWVPKMMAAMQGAPVQGMFRSRYSWLPPNHSLFKVYILGLFFILMLLGWIFFTLKSLTLGM
jgi:creatinine amidohydrolase/Fe(II)-dependent formamide hydrolase-like protein